MSDSGRISPTAHYTGYVWARNGLSHPELSSAEGRALFESLRPVLILSRALGGASLEPYLLARHLAIDKLLEQAIEQHGITQVLEVACGLSPRGWRFTERYGDRITYVEADLPEMADRKRRALERMGSLGEHHRVEEVDALSDDGPDSIGALASGLRAEGGLAIITEGLLGYLPGDDVEKLWRRFAVALGTFSHGRYFSDLHVGDVQTPQIRVFRVLLSAFVRGRVFLHWGSAAQARDALGAAGFPSAAVHRAATLAPEARGPGAGMAHIIEASTD
ncbi:MAG TPA: class I SAM-dependent methyltransferase [Solirubrobacteraceae bacterium]